MPRFKYIAYSKENQQLVGFLESASQEEARAELHKIGLSVLSIVESAEEAPSSEGKKSFEFQARDKTGKAMLGTIDAENLFQAYLKLFEGYRFKIDWIVDAALTEVQKEAQKPKNIKQLTEQYERYLEDQERKKTPWYKRPFQNNKIQKIQGNILIIQRQTEKVIERARTALELMQNDISPDVRVNIKNKIEGLLVLKTSTNVEHLQVLCDELLRLIQEQKNALKPTLDARGEADTSSRLNDIFQELYSLSHFKELKVDVGLMSNVLTKSLSAFNTFKESRKKPEEQEYVFRESKVAQARTSIQEAYANLWEQIKVYISLVISGKSKHLREETLRDTIRIWQSVVADQKEIRLLRRELSTLKKKRKAIQKKRLELMGFRWIGFDTIFYEIKLFAQWLLLFYGLYIILAHTVLKLGYPPLLSLARASVVESSLLGYILIFLLLIYTSISLQFRFFGKSLLSALLLVLGSAGIFLLVIGNL